MLALRSYMAYRSPRMESPAPSPATASPAGRRDRHRQRTRNLLTGAARTLIAEKGVAGLRIGDVTEVADVGRGSFYNYFESKDHLVEAVLSDSIQSLAAVAVTAGTGDPDPAVRACVADRRFIRLASEDREFARLLVSLHHGDDLFMAATLPYARAALEPGVASGRFSVTSLDVALLMLAGSAFALIRAILDDAAPPDADQAHAEAILRMLGVPDEEAREISRRPLGPAG
jgi:AcrR family transcriptional regulator